MRHDASGTLYRRDGLTDRLHLRLFTAERRQITPEWRTQDVLSSYWRFYANAEAGASLVLDGGEGFPLEAGRLYFVPAGVRFSCRCDAARVRHFYVHFDVLGLPAPALRELFGRPVCLPSSGVLEAEVGVLGDALAVPHPARGDDLTLHCRLKSLLYASLALCLEAAPEDRRERCLLHAARMEPVRPALELIEADLSGDLSNARLAALCCLSEDHFARRFRECVGAPPGEWVARRRVEAAAQRLLLTDDTIEGIAEACGFANRFYFSRVFARRMGAAPAAYRRAGRV